MSVLLVLLIDLICLSCPLCETDFKTPLHNLLCSPSTLMTNSNSSDFLFVTNHGFFSKIELCFKTVRGKAACPYPICFLMICQFDATHPSTDSESKIQSLVVSHNFDISYHASKTDQEWL